MPPVAGIRQPLGVRTAGGGDVGDASDAKDTCPRAWCLVVNGIDRVLASGSAVIARDSVLSLDHGTLASGEPLLPHRVRPRPRARLEWGR